MFNHILYSYLSKQRAYDLSGIHHPNHQKKQQVPDLGTESTKTFQLFRFHSYVFALKVDRLRSN
jgi:hypothetical protein